MPEALSTFQLAAPAWLLLLPIAVWLGLRSPRPASARALPFSSLRTLRGIGTPVTSPRSSVERWLLVASAVLLVVALARPRVERGRDDQTSEGIDILLVLDASRSMDTRDFEFEGRKISRREALLRVLADFIQARPRDRLGVVGFAEQAFLVSPLTLDHSWLLESVADIPLSLGTSIGSAVQAAVDLLGRAQSADKVAIVVTDGLNTSGVDPLTAAEQARRAGVRLYTVGVVGYDGMATRDVEEFPLSKMARLTGGQFFQAADGAGLQAIYQQIDALERSTLRQPRLRAWRELFPWFAGAALLLLVVDLIRRASPRARLS